MDDSRKRNRRMNDYGIFLVAKQTKYLVFLQITLKKNVELSAFFFISNVISELEKTISSKEGVYY